MRRRLADREAGTAVGRRSSTCRRLGPLIFDELCQRLAADPPLGGGSRHPESASPKIGIVPRRPPCGESQTQGRFSRRRCPIADKQVKTAQYGTQINGWYVNYSMVSFQKDPLQRASTNKYGPGAPYPGGSASISGLDRGPDGQPLNGTRNYGVALRQGPAAAGRCLLVAGPSMGRR